jgi:hypothetical protein
VPGNEPISLPFTIPARDHLGREEVEGILRFQPETVDFHWRLKGNVFVGSDNEMQRIEIPYHAVKEVKVKKPWFRAPELTLQLEDPTPVAKVPNVEVGRLVLILNKDSKVETEKLNNFIDYRRSVFLLDETNKRLGAMRDSDD